MQLDNLIPLWLDTLKTFTESLLDFYTENIIKPIRYIKLFIEYSMFIDLGFNFIVSKCTFYFDQTGLFRKKTCVYFICVLIKKKKLLPNSIIEIF